MTSFKSSEKRSEKTMVIAKPGEVSLRDKYSKVFWWSKFT
jgi:hypothetical protein